MHSDLKGILLDNPKLSKYNYATPISRLHDDSTQIFAQKQHCFYRKNNYLRRKDGPRTWAGSESNYESTDFYQSLFFTLLWLASKKFPMLPEFNPNLDPYDKRRQLDSHSILTSSDSHYGCMCPHWHTQKIYI